MLCLLARQSDSARAASSTDGNNYNFSSSGLGVTPFDRPTVTSVSSRSLQVVLNRDRLQSCVTASPAGHFKTAVTLRPGPGLRLPSPGPGSPSDPEGPCRRRHGRRGWGGGARTGRPTPAGRCFPSFASSLLIPFKSRLGINAGGAVVEQPCRMREVLGSNPAVFFILPILIY